MDSMGEELRSSGFATIGGTSGDPEYQKVPFQYHEIKSHKFDDDVKAVVCGLDYKISYSKILLASLYI